MAYLIPKFGMQRRKNEKEQVNMYKLFLDMPLVFYLIRHQVCQLAEQPTILVELSTSI